MRQRAHLMALCIHRPETPAFWTPCNPCKCGEQVKTDTQDTEERGELT